MGLLRVDNDLEETVTRLRQCRDTAAGDEAGTR